MVKLKAREVKKPRDFPLTHAVVTFEPRGATYTIMAALSSGGQVRRATTHPAGCTQAAFLAPLLLRGFSHVIAIPLDGPLPSWARLEDWDPIAMAAMPGAVV